jgi:hypothetical protein
VEASKKVEKCDENTEKEGGEMEKKSKARSIERRNRGDNSVNEESIELLAIPGVGPRNLRKLVDKGFQGVAQLKQLYKDKVMIKRKIFIPCDVLRQNNVLLILKRIV